MIHETTDKFEFNRLTLCKPISNAGGSFFIRYSIDEKPLYIKPPKCYIKQIVAKPGKKMYCDIVFQQENDAFIRWMENLESHTQQLLYDHRSEWFKTDLEKDDIEQSFSSPMKVYKSGKQYIVRANIPSKSGSLKIYDEEERVIPVENIVENMNVMVILEMQGVRSGSNFQIDIEVKQMMVLKPDEIFNTCILKQNNHINPHFQKEDIHLPSLANPFLDPTNDSVQDDSTRSVSLLNDKEESLEPSISNEDTIVIGDPDSLCEVDFDLDKMGLQDDSAVCLKERKQMYYQMYEEARQKARVARDLALSAYLEAKQIKNKYMLDDILDSSSEESEDEGSESETF